MASSGQIAVRCDGCGAYNKITATSGTRKWVCGECGRDHVTVVVKAK